MDIQNLNRLDIIGNLKDMLAGRDIFPDPFLYYLPNLLENHQLSGIEPIHAVKFAQLALKYEKSPLMQDALKILNKLVSPEDGSLIKAAPDIFYENRNFFWKELGTYTKTTDVILHIFNRTIFLNSLGKE
jgi:hypothetical protein